MVTRSVHHAITLLNRALAACGPDRDAVRIAALTQAVGYVNSAIQTELMLHIPSIMRRISVDGHGHEPESDPIRGDPDHSEHAHITGIT